MSEYFPEYETEERQEDGSVEPSSDVVPHHRHPDGYFFLRLPCSDPNKVPLSSPVMAGPQWQKTPPP